MGGKRLQHGSVPRVPALAQLKMRVTHGHLHRGRQDFEMVVVGDSQ